MRSISSLKDGEHYAVIENDGIVKYDYKTSQKKGYIAKGRFKSYEFSTDESKILLLTEYQPLYRHSFFGKFQVKNLKNGKTLKLNNGDFTCKSLTSLPICKVAFVVENNLFYQDLETEKIVQITRDGERNKILNGISPIGFMKKNLDIPDNTNGLKTPTH